jgi:hypothetical protein
MAIMRLSQVNITDLTKTFLYICVVINLPFGNKKTLFM